ncbi:MAG TPA: RDD family protein [Rhizomicrobium sp.]|nr:RDD family protein [Rhizomicrobium sp.]
MSGAASQSIYAAASPDNRVREFVTPEGVDLRLVLAEASERMTAFLLDVAIMIGSLVALTVLLAFVAWLAGSGKIMHEAVPVIWLLMFFFLRNFYFMAFEISPRAATPGKRILGLRVAMRDGGPLTGEAIFARNALRELEIFLPLTFLALSAKGMSAWVGLLGLAWCVAFVFFPLFNRDRLRVGDLVAGTWVVHVPRRDLTIDLTESRAPSAIKFSEAALDAYGIKELNVLEDVLRRRDPEIMKAVAARIREKIAMPAREPDAEFLAAYYAALRGRLESRLLFGRRRRDKHDKV